MAKLEVNSLTQTQSISEPAIFQTVPEDILRHIVNEVLKSQDPRNFVSETLKVLIRYKETGLLPVSRDASIIFNVEGAEKVQKPVLPEGFKINSIERVLAYISIITALATILANNPPETIVYNQTIIEKCEQCYIEQKASTNSAK